MQESGNSGSELSKRRTMRGPCSGTRDPSLWALARPLRKNGKARVPDPGLRLCLSRHGRRSPVLPPPFLEGKPRPTFLRLLHPVLADLPRDEGDVAEVEVDVVVGLFAGGVAVGEDVDLVAEVFGDVVVFLDRFLRFQD